MSEYIQVHTSTDNDYKISVGFQNLEKELLNLKASLSDANKAYLLVDENVWFQHETYILNAFSVLEIELILETIPQGERSKSLNMYSRLMDFLLAKGISRQTPIFAIGGGVIGDLCGYVAATIYRGVPLYHVPTTLLAMVDSSIGGKTGINHSRGKNLIGSFYQPKAVIADVQFLTTLNEKEWVNGLSEILKYGFIKSPEILEESLKLIDESGFENPELWLPLIQKSAQIKVDVVAEDVLEAGIREYLNFGHTYAHAIENFTGYGKITHGEAVFAGMMAALLVSGKSNESLKTDLLKPFRSLYKIDLSDLANHIKDLIDLMRRDKKVKKDSIRLVLLKDMGDPTVTVFDDLETLQDSWSFIIEEFSP